MSKHKLNGSCQNIASCSGKTYETLFSNNKQQSDTPTVTHHVHIKRDAQVDIRI